MRHLRLSILLASVAVCVDAGTGLAQMPTEEAFITADGVKLKGYFHTSPTGAAQNDSVVVLLYPPGGGRSMDASQAWSGITKALLGAGFHVFQFDWRGHGKSTDIEDTEQFWNLKGANANTGLWNAKHVKGLKDKPIKNRLTAKDFDPKYFPVYVNDLAAVRQHLDAKNDKRTINTSSLYLIGAGDTATLGLIWMTAEWRRGAVRGDGMKNPAGVDLAGAIWLSGSRNPAIGTKLLEAWKPIASKLRDRNPMLFLHGESDFKGSSEGKYFVDSYLVAKGSKTLNPLEQTFLTPIKGTDASGMALLSAGNTEETILQYMKARQKDRASVDWKERKFTNPYFVDLKPFYLVP